MTGAEQYTVDRWYDLARDDYVISWSVGGDELLEIRVEDETEPETRDGRGTRVCAGGIEVPLDEFMAVLRSPFLPIDDPDPAEGAA